MRKAKVSTLKKMSSKQLEKRVRNLQKEEESLKRKLSKAEQKYMWNKDKKGIVGGITAKVPGYVKDLRKKINKVRIETGKTYERYREKL